MLTPNLAARDKFCGAAMNPLHRALLGELANLGLRPRLRVTGGTHVRIEWNVGARTDFIVTALPPSDRRALVNARAEVRRRLKAAAIETELALHAEQNPRISAVSPAAHRSLNATAHSKGEQRHG
jgi:hypothetical protein